MADSPPEHPRLGDPEVRERLAHLDDLLAEVETIPGPSGEIALDAVSALAAVYGEALARVTDHASCRPEVLEALMADELLGHLLALHDAHPEPVERRVERTLERLRPEVRQKGGELEFAGVTDGVATLRLSLTGCSAGPVVEALREAVRAAAPELSEVTVTTGGGRPAFVPLDGLRRPAARSGAAS